MLKPCETFFSEDLKAIIKSITVIRTQYDLPGFNGCKLGQKPAAGSHHSCPLTSTKMAATSPRPPSVSVPIRALHSHSGDVIWSQSSSDWGVEPWDQGPAHNPSGANHQQCSAVNHAVPVPVVCLVLVNMILQEHLEGPLWSQRRTHQILEVKGQGQCGRMAFTWYIREAADVRVS